MNGALHRKYAHNFIALDVVVGSNFLDMCFVGGVGDKLYDCLYIWNKLKSQL